LPLAIAGAVVFWFFARDNRLERWEAVALVGCGCGTLVFLIRTARREPDAVKAEFAARVPAQLPLWLAVGFALVGFGGLIGGAALTAAEAVPATRDLGLNSHRLGLLSALGTTAPLVVGCVRAARRGWANVCLGMVVGFVLFNPLLVAGTVGLVRPLLVTEVAVLNEVPVMALFALSLVAVLGNGLQVTRREGAVLVLAFAGFVAWEAWK
ncbi:MAG: hypothetical protein K2V38_01775, partial [Gemmataceae bacterium]|nr:hypothetical protein [Gemmataceae bacterium]